MRRRTGERPLAALALALGLAAAPAAARADDVSLEAVADRTELAADEVLTLRITLESGEAPTALELPEGDLPFEIVSRSQSRQSSFALGGPGGVQARQVLVTRLGLAPKRAGALVIPPIAATVGGKRYETRPIRVTVLPAGAAPRAAPGPAPDAPGGTFRGWERDLVLDVELDRREVFLGEQVTATVRLYSPLGVVAYERFTPPPHDGFWTEELETPQTLRYEVRAVNGVPTRVYLLTRIALFPTRSGALSIGPFSLDVAVRTGTDNPFDPFPEVRRVQRRSAPRSLTVKPLPPGAPPGFASVNVGSWKLEARAPEGPVAAGDPVPVRLVARGDGNVRALALPRLPAVPGAKAFEPTGTEEVATRGGRLGGTRTVETVLVPERTGELVVPPLEWPVFDPRAGRYEVLRTAELRVRVGPGAGPGAASTAGSNALAAGLRPIRADLSLSRRGPPPWRSPLFLLAVALPPAAFAAAAAAARVRDRSGERARRVRAAGRAARRALARARRRRAAGDPAALLAEVERALLGYAADRLGRPAGGLTRDALAAALAEAGAHPPAVRALSGALDALDRARFGAGGAPDEVLAAAERALALLEEADWSAAEGRA